MRTGELNVMQEVKMKAEDIQDSKWKVPKDMVDQWGEISRLRTALAEKKAELSDLREMHRIAWQNEAELANELAELNEDINTLRSLLWLNHGHTGQYGDDGEMQCAQCFQEYGFWDWKRTPIKEISLKILYGNLRAAVEKPKEDLLRCPDCGRIKAMDAVGCAMGKCPKWFAIHDQEAHEDCRRVAAEKSGIDTSKIQPDYRFGDTEEKLVGQELNGLPEKENGE